MESNQQSINKTVQRSNSNTKKSRQRTGRNLALLYWFTVEGDVETQIPNDRGKIVAGPQRLPALEKIRDILELLYGEEKIEQYVCAHERGTTAVISVNIVYLRCVKSKKVIRFLFFTIHSVYILYLLKVHEKDVMNWFEPHVNGCTLRFDKERTKQQKNALTRISMFDVNLYHRGKYYNHIILF